MIGQTGPSPCFFHSMFYTAARVWLLKLKSDLVTYIFNFHQWTHEVRYSALNNVKAYVNLQIKVLGIYVVKEGERGIKKKRSVRENTCVFKGLYMEYSCRAEIVHFSRWLRKVHCLNRKTPEQDASY